MFGKKEAQCHDLPKLSRATGTEMEVNSGNGS
jgi:hypothetical protein